MTRVPVPILLATGFLGAGKTTTVNRILAHAAGRRIAAVVNDFGAINIDAQLIAGAGDGVVSLTNGCICCSLEGDLLRTLASILRRSPRPDHIVIETSGVADPADIVRNLMDPVIWKEAPLETVLCVVDATTPVVQLDDALLRSQVRAADVVALSKTDLVEAANGSATLSRRSGGQRSWWTPRMAKCPPRCCSPTTPIARRRHASPGRVARHPTGSRP
jgi:G3E family GTPase